MRATAGLLLQSALVLAAIAVVMFSHAMCAAVPTDVPAHASPPAPALAGLPDFKAVQARHPGCDAVVLFDSLVVSLDGENRVSKRCHRAVMLFTDNAINRYGDPRILFNAAAQDLSLVVARAYMRDGTIVDTQKNGINQTAPFALEAAPDYVDWQETVVTHVGLEKGCVAELHYVIRDKAPSPWLSGVEIFSSEDPVELRVLEVRTSGSEPMKCASLGGAPEPDASVDGVRRWTVRDIGGRTPFDGGAWEGDYFPIACYSTAASWSGALSGLAATIEEKAGALDFFVPIVKRATEDLRAREDEDRILAIHSLALDCVAAVHAPFGLLAAAPREARRIYESGYASPLDRAVLLTAMLKAGGYEPVPVLVSRGRAWTEEAPAPELFGSLLVAVKSGDRELSLDPEASFKRDPMFRIAGMTTARLDGRISISRMSAKAGVESRSSLSLVLKPGEEGNLAGEGTAVLEGVFSPYYLLRGAGTQAADFVKAHVRDLFEGAELTAWIPRRLERSGAEITFSFTVKLPEAHAGERVYFALPKPFEAGESGIERVRLERSTLADAVRLEPCILDVRCEIEPPAEWRVISAPPRAEAKNEIGAARAGVDTADAERVICTRSLTIEESLVPPAAYGKLKALLSAFGEDELLLERR